MVTRYVLGDYSSLKSQELHNIHIKPSMVNPIENSLAEIFRVLIEIIFKFLELYRVAIYHNLCEMIHQEP